MPQRLAHKIREEASAPKQAHSMCLVFQLMSHSEIDVF